MGLHDAVPDGRVINTLEIQLRDISSGFLEKQYVQGIVRVFQIQSKSMESKEFGDVLHEAYSKGKSLETIKDLIPLLEWTIAKLKVKYLEAEKSLGGKDGK